MTTATNPVVRPLRAYVPLIAEQFELAEKAGSDYYAGNRGYLLACKAGAERIDLNGETAGMVSAEHAAGARERLTAYAAKRARRASNVPARHARNGNGAARAQAS